MKKKLLILFALGICLALSLGASFAVLRVLSGSRTDAFPSLGEGRIIEVYAPGSLAQGARIARVSIGPNGDMGLQVEQSGATAELERALTKARDASTLPLLSEEILTVSGKTGRASSIDMVGPQDPRYVWAVIDFLRREGIACAPAAGAGP